MVMRVDVVSLTQDDRAKKDLGIREGLLTSRVRLVTSHLRN